MYKIYIYSIYGMYIYLKKKSSRFLVIHILRIVHTYIPHHPSPPAGEKVIDSTLTEFDINGM